jgi:secondary thiamine-phosphate synthase enzyme
MEVITRKLHLDTKGYNDIIDLTGGIHELLAESGLQEGTATIFAVGSTAGISTIEFEPGLVETDIPKLLDKLAPYAKAYAHNATWGCDNGAAHLRSSLVGSSIVVPFVNASLTLGTWQQVILLDFDTRPRSREVVVQLMGIKQS